MRSRTLPPMTRGFGALRHVTLLDEAHVILRTRLPALANLVRMSRSKGGVVMLVSQSPDDFEAAEDGYLDNMGLTLAFNTQARAGPTRRIFGDGYDLDRPERRRGALPRPIRGEDAEGRSVGAMNRSGNPSTESPESNFQGMGLCASPQFQLTPQEKEKHPDGNHLSRGSRRRLRPSSRPTPSSTGGRGFQRRIGYGTRPALVVIDMANAWTRPGYAFTCDNMDEIIPATQALLATAREKRIPIVFTTTAYQDPTGPRSDTGLWHLKIPAETLLEGSEAASIDDRLDPQPGEQVIVKKRASAFHGTYLAGYLRSQRVDTVIITGVTMAGCVRHSTEGRHRRRVSAHRGARGGGGPGARGGGVEPVRHRRQVRRR